jgi:hypothetical protein
MCDTVVVFEWGCWVCMLDDEGEEEEEEEEQEDVIE